MNRTDRLYALVEELRAISPRFRSARELAARFEVSVRTVERDISALQRSGVAIHAEPGRRGYALGRSLSLPPIDFTPAEAAAVAVALERAGEDPLALHARSALHKLVAAMTPAGEAGGVGETREVGEAGEVEEVEGGGEAEGAVEAGAGKPVAGARTAVEPEPYPRVSRVIEQALLHRRVLRIEYEDRKGRVTTREVEPVIFVGGRGGHWYLVGMCRLRKDARAFRLDRIGRAEETEEAAPERGQERFSSRIPQMIVGAPDLE
ncbi:helix-turn-helix transcriptional regulator [Streptosporangium sp. CA-135522]|uniref:helix-turn-helix transcriptional regulator n=1 Tax=Streptosporangium sp. CA-135522 TaxID=3240072 RepID=UPI003D8F7889